MADQMTNEEMMGYCKIRRDCHDNSMTTGSTDENEFDSTYECWMDEWDYDNDGEFDEHNKARVRLRRLLSGIQRRLDNNFVGYEG